jgi:NTE family protein
MGLLRGFLDRLPEEPQLMIEGISGASAGATNAAIMAHDYTVDGDGSARKALGIFWRKVSEAARGSSFPRGPLDILLGRWTLDHSPVFLAMDMMARAFSPYDLNPGGANPLRAILAETVDFGRLPGNPAVRDGNVRTGRGRVFRNGELTPDVLLLGSETVAWMKMVALQPNMRAPQATERPWFPSVAQFTVTSETMLA